MFNDLNLNKTRNDVKGNSRWSDEVRIPKFEDTELSTIPRFEDIIDGRVHTPKFEDKELR